jgi:hypothetical protein
MSVKGSGDPSLRIIDEWDGGFGWMAYPTEKMQRASHALVVDDEVWVLDPVDAPGLDESLTDRGDVAGVLVCLDRHKRDAADIARRHEVPVYLPEWMSGVASELNAPVRRYGETLEETGYRALRVRNSSFPPWREVALYDDDSGTLYVPEAVGTATFFRAPGERLGIHPMLRAIPPTRALGGLEPERILVGHGEGLFEGAADALADALTHSRARLPAAYARAFRSFL